MSFHTKTTLAVALPMLMAYAAAGKDTTCSADGLCSGRKSMQRGNSLLQIKLHAESVNPPSEDKGEERPTLCNLILANSSSRCEKQIFPYTTTGRICEVTCSKKDWCTTYAWREEFKTCYLIKVPAVSAKVVEDLEEARKEDAVALAISTTKAEISKVQDAVDKKLKRTQTLVWQFNDYLSQDRYRDAHKKYLKLGDDLSRLKHFFGVQAKKLSDLMVDMMKMINGYGRNINDIEKNLKAIKGLNINDIEENLKAIKDDFDLECKKLRELVVQLNRYKKAIED